MALIKSQDDIVKLRKAGTLLSNALGAAVKAAKPGVTMAELDKIAEKVIRDGGGEPSFLNYTAGGDIPFPSTMCISVNEELIHGTGDRDYVFKDGDFVGLDIGLWLDGVCTDMAMTVPIGNVTDEVKKLLDVTRRSLANGIKAAKNGARLQDISAAIENTITPHNYGIVTSYGGHGVGHKVHEDPFIPNYVSRQHANPKLKTGMVLALEPMVTVGEPQLELGSDNWVAVTSDGSATAHFEQTIAITDNGSEIITPFPEV